MATNVPISAYTGPLSQVDWTGRYFSLHAGYFRLSWRAILAYLGLISVGFVLALMGPPVQQLNWVIGAALQIVALPFLLMPGNVIATWLFGYIAGQPGGEKGFDIKDGTEKGAEYVRGFGRFVGYVLFFGALPLMSLGLFDIRLNPLGALAVLTFSISLTIGGLMLFQESKWFMGFVWTIYLLIVLWILAGFIPGLREGQSNLVQGSGGFVTTRIVKNDADLAKERAEQRIRQQRITTAKTCYDQLPGDPKPDAKARCDALQRAIDEPLFQSVSSAASGVIDHLKSKSGSPGTSTAADALNQGVDAKSESRHKGAPVKRSGDHPASNGVVTLRQGPAGTFDLGVHTGSVKVTVVAETGKQRFAHNDATGYQEWHVNAYGVFTDAGGHTHIAPAHHGIPLPGAPMGALVVLADGQAKGVVGGTCYAVGSNAQLTLQVNHWPLWQGAGNRSWTVRVEEC